MILAANLSGCGGGGSSASGSGAGSGSAPFTLTAVSTTPQHLALNTPMAAFFTIASLGVNGDYQTPLTLMQTGTLPKGLSKGISGVISGTPTEVYPSADVSWYYRDANGKETNRITINFTVLDNVLDLTGVTGKDGTPLSGKLVFPFMVANGSNLVDQAPYLKRSSDGKTHTYYYWDANGDGTNAGDLVTHDLLDQIFNGGTLGDNAKDTNDISTTNTITLSNGLHIHLLTTAEFTGVVTQTSIAGWPVASFWTSSQFGNAVSVVGQHDTMYYIAFSLSQDTSTYPVFFEVW